MAVHAQWKQSLTGQASLVRNISVVNDDIVWVKDQTGVSVSITLDGGKNWTTKNFSAELTAAGTGGLCAVNATTAYTVVSQTSLMGVYKTTNSGDTWTRQATAYNNQTLFPDFVYFWNELEGVTVGDALADGYFDIYTTSNGGVQWNKVTANLPATDGDYSYNSNTSYRVHGNTFYFLTGKGKILRSADKGMTWSLINTPTGISFDSFDSFDFRDDFHGLLKSSDNRLYSTSNGGIDWTLTGTGNCYANIAYNQTKNVYLSSQTGEPNKQTWYGLSYSKDDGMTWTIQSGFKNVGIEPIGISSSGKMIVGGWEYVYRTDNYEGVNVSVFGAEIKSSNSMDVFYSTQVDGTSSQDTTNYDVGYIENKYFKGIKIHSITQDPADKSVVHLVFDSTLPQDTIKMYVYNVFDNNGKIDFPILNAITNNVVLYNFVTPKTINVTSAGALSTLLTATALATIDTLTITGTIDARDFKTIRDNMPLLSVLDLSGVSIAAYTGTAGTQSTANVFYPANSIPSYAFYNINGSVTKDSLKAISMPISLNSIGAYSFYGCKGLTGTLVLPNSVTSIGTFAFASCSGLKGLSLSNTLTTIGTYAFKSCTGITGTLIIPASVTNIGLGAFMRLLGLISVDENSLNYSSADGVLFDKSKSILILCPTNKSGSYVIPSTVTFIEDYAFFWCQYLSSVTIPVSTTTIGVQAFSYCYGLASLTIPYSITTIKDIAFYGFSALINVDSNNQTYSSLNGVLYDKNKSRLIQFPASITGNFSIPASVTSIDNYAFSNCSGISSLTIPSLVNYIGNNAFFNCTGLTSITSNPGYPVDLSSISGVFTNVNTTSCVLNVPYKSKSLYAAANQWSDFTNIIENSQGFLLGTNQLTFSSSAANSQVSIQANVSWTVSSDQSWLTVSPNSGTGNNTLTVTVLANLTELTRTATITVTSNGLPFQIMTVKQSGIPKTINVTAGSLATVLNATELNGVNDLTLTGTIDARDFKTMRDRMPVLEKIDLSGVNIVAYIGTEGTASTTSTNYPANEIPQNAFYPKYTLASVVLPLTINSIASQAFMYCNSLSSIYISSSVTHIGDFAFDACSADINVDAANPAYSSLDGVLFDKNKTLIIQCATTKTGSYTIPSTVNEIGYWAFENCTNLASIVIPATVQTIRDGAFYYTSGLTSIYSYSTVPVDLSSSFSVFEGVNKAGCTLNVPIGSKSAYQAAVQWQNFMNIAEQITSLSAIDDTTIRLYPNPVTDGFYVRGTVGTVLLKLFDLNGRVLLDRRLTENSFISTSTLSKGVYVVKIITGDGTIERKMVKK